MAELKTKRNKASVEKFLRSVTDKKRKEDSLVILDLMKKITGEDPDMWGTSIVGFGSHHYIYESGREGDWFNVGFSPRKQSLTLYIMGGFKRHAELMARLGKYKTGKSCLYINKLEDIDMKILKRLIKESDNYMKKKKW